MNLDSAVLYTSDIQVITDFYEKTIGLELDYKAGDEYVQFKFANGVGLGIKNASEEREVPGAQTILIAVEDAAKKYQWALSKKLSIQKQLVEEEWALEFGILDPDGNKVEFVQRK